MLGAGSLDPVFSSSSSSWSASSRPRNRAEPKNTTVSCIFSAGCAPEAPCTRDNPDQPPVGAVQKVQVFISQRSGCQRRRRIAARNHRGWNGSVGLPLFPAGVHGERFVLAGVAAGSTASDLCSLGWLPGSTASDLLLAGWLFPVPCSLILYPSRWRSAS